jgi:hypothetical protein
VRAPRVAWGELQVADSYTLHGGQARFDGGAWEIPGKEYWNRDIAIRWSYLAHLGTPFEILHAAGRAMSRDKLISFALARSIPS